MPPPLSCEHCDRSFTKRYSLNRHLYSIHHVAPLKMPRKAILCPMRDCNDTFAYHGPLRSHLKAVHGIQLQGQKITFSSMKDFFEWKKKEENKFFVKYVKACGVQRLLDHTEVYRFNCHRTGTYTPEGKGLRKLKSQGSCKIGASCPSTITAHRHPNDNVTCTYCLTHVGHETTQEDVPVFTEVELPNPSSVSNQQIIKIIYPSAMTNIIAANVPESTDIASIVPRLTSTLVQNHDIFKQFLLSDEDQVILSIILGQEMFAVEMLKSIRDKSSKEFFENYSNLTDKLKVAKDAPSFKNIDVPLEMESFLGQLLANDDENPVLFYEHISLPVEEANAKAGRINFVIMNSLQSWLLQSLGNGGVICIDPIYGSCSAAQDNLLIAIFVLNQSNGWSLCALCMCSEMSEGSLSVIFTQIRNRTGKIVPSVLLVDHEDCIQKSWECAMGECDTYLICSWHLDKMAQSLILQCEMDAVKLACTYKLMLNLLKCRCEKRFNELVAVVTESPLFIENSEFRKFFHDYFVEQKSKSAEYVRNDFIHKATCLMEPIHYLLEHVCQSYGEELSHALCTLLYYFRKHTFEGVDMRLLQSTFVDLNASELQASFLLSKSDVEFVEEHQWSVVSGCRKYTMERDMDGCSYHGNVTSMSCDLCLLSFKCSCINNTICWKICRHVHLLSKQLQEECWLEDGIDLTPKEDAMLKVLCAPTPEEDMLVEEEEMENMLVELQQSCKKIMVNAKRLRDRKGLMKLRDSLLNSLKISKSLIGEDETTKEQGIQCDIDSEKNSLNKTAKSNIDHDYTLSIG